MQIVHVSSEYAPLAKAGGLGDVVFSLSKALSKLSHDVSVILPFYSHIPREKIDALVKTPFALSTQVDKGSLRWEVFQGTIGKVSLYLLSPLDPNDYFSRGEIYGQHDDSDRFLLFSCAAKELISHSFTNAVIHLHDWPTALLASLLKSTHKTVLTIHNIAYQGHCEPGQFIHYGLSEHLPSFTTQYGDIRLLYGGIAEAKKISTVSPSYADEIQTPEFGCGLQDLMQRVRGKLHGILNGIDIEYWNPETDPTLFQNYSLSDPAVFEKKKKNKAALFRKFSKQYVEAPLFCEVTRITHQKGPELLISGAKTSLESGASFALSGTLLPDAAPLFSAFETQYVNHPQSLLFFGFDEKLARLIYAASDFILIPSLFEPCGLTQMIALCYGTIPIVTSTGGLKDTIRSWKEEKGNGIILENYSERAMTESVHEALSLSEEKRKSLLRSIEPSKFSWETSAQHYLDLYRN